MKKPYHNHIAKEMNIEYFDIPKPLILANYYSAIDRYIDQLKDLPEVISIYRMGSFSSPGISDLDLIVVLKDAKISDSSKYGISKINNMPDTRGVFRHGPMIMQEKVFQHLEFLFDASELSLQFGKEISLINLEEELKIFRDICLVIEFLPRLLHRFTRIISTKKIPVRESIASSYSALHFSKLHSQIRAILPLDFHELSKEITSLREDWHSYPNVLVNLLERILEDLFEISWTIDEKFIKPWITSSIHHDVYFRQDSWLWAFFVNERTTQVDYSSKFWGISPFEYLENIICLPKGFLSYYLYIGHLYPEYGQIISHRLVPKIDDETFVELKNANFSKFLLKRMDLITQQINLLDRAKFPYGLIADLGIYDKKRSIWARSGIRPKIEFCFNQIYKQVRKKIKPSLM